MSLSEAESFGGDVSGKAGNSSGGGRLGGLVD